VLPAFSLQDAVTRDAGKPFHLLIQRFHYALVSNGHLWQKTEQPSMLGAFPENTGSLSALRLTTRTSWFAVLLIAARISSCETISSIPDVPLQDGLNRMFDANPQAIVAATREAFQTEGISILEDSSIPATNGWHLVGVGASDRLGSGEVIRVVIAFSSPASVVKMDDVYVITLKLHETACASARHRPGRSQKQNPCASPVA